MSGTDLCKESNLELELRAYDFGIGTCTRSPFRFAKSRGKLAFDGVTLMAPPVVAALGQAKGIRLKPSSNYCYLFIYLCF